MIKTSYNGQDVYLLDVAPRWESGFGLAAALAAFREVGLTNRESRRGAGLRLRLQCQFEILTEGADARRIAAGLRALKTERVLVPLWPAVVAWADRATRPIAGGLNLAFKEDFSQWEIYEGSAPGWPAATDLVAPLMWGRLDGKKGNWLSNRMFQWSVQFTESSPPGYAVLPGPGITPSAWTSGPRPPAWVTAGVAAPYLFPFEINYAEAEVENFVVTILREEIGYGRELAETFYEHTPARELEAGYSLTSQVEAGRLLQFFLEHGAGKAFWSGDWVNGVELTANIAAIDTVLHVSDAGTVGVNDYLAFITPDGIAASRRVTAIAAGTVTISSALGAAYAAGTTVVMGLVLSRFQLPSLELSWQSGEHVEVRLPVRELPEEYAPAADETLESTIGLLGTRCYLYDFARVLAGVTYTTRFTSFENDLTLGADDYLANKITHSDIRQGLYLEADQLEVKTDTFEDNPMLLMAALKSESPIRVTVRQAEVDDDWVTAINAAVLFTGELVNAAVRGSRITGTAVTGGTMFDRKVPRVVFGPSCNNALFDLGCNPDGTMAKALWKFSAVVSDPGSAGYPFEFELSTLTGVGARAIAALVAVAVGANYFAHGYMEFGTGTDWNRRAVLISTSPVAGVLTVTLDRDPEPFPAISDAVVLYPGCDLMAATCKAKFDNYVNFLGHPFMPIANPSLTQSGQPSGGGKK